MSARDTSRRQTAHQTLRWAVATALTCVLLACSDDLGGDATETAPPNLVFLTLDTTRADHFGCYGYFRDTTPEIDELAAGSLVFERCLAPMATTLPSHTSLMTGTYPLEHGIVANFKDRGLKFTPSEKLNTLASVLADRDYTTAGFVSATPLKTHSGIDAGFSVFDQPAEARRKADATNRAVFDWLRTAPAAPYFLWVHYFDPHSSYSPPAPYDRQYGTDDALLTYMKERSIGGDLASRSGTINLYDGEIRFLDAQIGKLLDALRARPDWERTVVVLVADHGEGIGQHGELGHGSIWDEQLHVPLLMRIPGLAPRRISTQIGLPDVLSTLSALVPELPMQPLLAQTSGRNVLADAEARPLLSLAVRRNVDEETQSVLTTEEWSFVRVVDEQDRLFHRLSDPFELEDVSRDHQDVTQSMRAQLLGIIERQRARGTLLRSADAEGEALSAERLEQLDALGYGGRE